VRCAAAKLRVNAEKPRFFINTLIFLFFFPLLLAACDPSKKYEKWKKIIFLFAFQFFFFFEQLAKWL
jgi:hypothetical protein